MQNRKKMAIENTSKHFLPTLQEIIQNGEKLPVPLIISIRNNVTKEQIESVADVLPYTVSGSKLYLTSVNLEAESVKYLSEALPFVEEDFELFLYNTNIGSQGPKHLANALKHLPNNFNNFKFRLKRCDITDEDVEYLAAPLGKKGPINFFFDLSENPRITKVGIKKLAEMMLANTQIQLKLNTPRNEFNKDLITIEACHVRNQLLAKHRDNPDFIYYIKKLSYESGLCSNDRPEAAPSLKVLTASFFRFKKKEKVEDIIKKMPDFQDFFIRLEQMGEIIKPLLSSLRFEAKPEIDNTINKKKCSIM